MKKILIATTALVAFAASANAAEPIKLSVGGFAEQWIGYADQDDDAGRAKFDVQGDTELLVKGSTKLDNGITVGVTVEVEAGGTGSTTRADRGSIDESYITVSGGFGSLIVGQQDNVGQIIHNASPDVGIGLQDGDADRWISTTGSTFTDIGFATDVDADSDKIIYVSPAFAGLQFGASYTPDINAENAGDQGIAATSFAFAGNALVPAADLSDLWVAGFAYNNKFGDVSVKADVGYGVIGVKTSGVDDVAAYQAGLNVGFAGFTVGGGFAHREGADAGAGDLVDNSTWDLGVSYATGPYAVSLSYLNSFEEVDEDSSSHAWMLSGAYTMGPGVAWKSSFVVADYEDTDGDTANDGWAVVTGLRLDF